MIMQMMMCVYWIVYLVGVHVLYVLYMIVSSTTQDGFSPLYIGSRWGRTEIVDILLRSGADPNLPCMV